MRVVRPRGEELSYEAEKRFGDSVGGGNHSEVVTVQAGIRPGEALCLCRFGLVHLAELQVRARGVGPVVERWEPLFEELEGQRKQLAHEACAKLVVGKMRAKPGFAPPFGPWRDAAVSEE